MKIQIVGNRFSTQAKKCVSDWHFRHNAIAC